MTTTPLTEHEALLQFLYLAPVGLVQTNALGEVDMLNPLAAQLLMPVAPDGELCNLFDALEALAPELRDMAHRHSADFGTICDRHRVQLTAGLRSKDAPRCVDITLIKLDTARLMAVLIDSSQVVQQERLLRQSEAWFNAILTGVRQYAMTSVDEQGCIENWNESVGRLTGHAPHAVVGQPFSVFYPPGAITAEQVADRLHEADVDGWSLDEGWRVRADGQRFWGSTMLVPLEDRSPKHRPYSYALIVRDTSDKRGEIDHVRRSITLDHLTHLPNRRAFFEAAEIELQRFRRRPRNLALVMFDCDHFKAINDAHGHPGGDEVLRQFAQCLRSHLREVDLVARIGGEEFVVLLPSTDQAGALAFAECVRDAAERDAVPFEQHDIRFTVSAGVCMMTTEIDSLDGLIKMADAALYDAKLKGRNRVAISSSPAAVATARRLGEFVSTRH